MKTGNGKAQDARMDLTSLGQFQVIYADPPWRYAAPKAVYEHSQIEKSYPTMPLEEICAIKVPRAKDAVLYLWCPAALLPYGMEVMNAWGFKYKTCQIWEKISDRPGLGYYFEMRHELLLFGKRGKIHAPPPRTRPPSVVHAKTREHSRKPDCFYDQIERQYPLLSKIELFARNSRAGWASWGNEVDKFTAATLSPYLGPEKRNRATKLDEYVPRPSIKPRARPKRISRTAGRSGRTPPRQ